MKFIKNAGFFAVLALIPLFSSAVHASDTHSCSEAEVQLSANEVWNEVLNYDHTAKAARIAHFRFRAGLIRLGDRTVSHTRTPNDLNFLKIRDNVQLALIKDNHAKGRRCRAINRFDAALSVLENNRVETGPACPTDITTIIDTVLESPIDTLSDNAAECEIYTESAIGFYNGESGNASGLTGVSYPGLNGEFQLVTLTSEQVVACAIYSTQCDTFVETNK